MGRPDPGSKAKCPDYSAGRAIQSIHDKKNQPLFAHVRKVARNCNREHQKGNSVLSRAELLARVLFLIYLWLAGVQVRLELNLGQPRRPQLPIQCS